MDNQATEECPVCYETRELIKFHCNHKLCYGCYCNLKYIKKCPLCRVELVDLDLIGSIDPDPRVLLSELFNQINNSIQTGQNAMEEFFNHINPVEPQNVQIYDTPNGQVYMAGNVPFLNNLMDEFINSLYAPSSQTGRNS